MTKYLLLSIRSLGENYHGLTTAERRMAALAFPGISSISGWQRSRANTFRAI